MTAEIERDLLLMAESRYVRLLESGIDEDTARDRVWACYARAFGEDGGSIDNSDTFFANKLRNAAMA